MDRSKCRANASRPVYSLRPPFGACRPEDFKQYACLLHPGFAGTDAPAGVVQPRVTRRFEEIHVIARTASAFKLSVGHKVYGVSGTAAPRPSVDRTALRPVPY